MKRIIQGLFLSMAAGFAPLAMAGVVVIVNPAVKAASLSEEEARQLYMGRLSVLPDGTRVAPVDAAEGSPTREQFLQRVLGKTEQQYRTFWTRQVFTGKGQPPRIAASDAEVIRLVTSGTGFVGYIDSKSVTPQVKVLLRAE